MSAITATPKLYEIQPAIDEFERRIEENGGIITPEIEQEWAAFLQGGRDKLESTAFVILRAKHDIEQCEAEIARLAERKKSFQQKAERLKSLALYALMALGGRVKTSFVTMYVGRSGGGDVVEPKEGADLKALSEQFPDLVRVKYELNCAAAKALRKSGGQLPDCLTVRHNEPTEWFGIK